MPSAVLISRPQPSPVLPSAAIAPRCVRRFSELMAVCKHPVAGADRRGSRSSRIRRSPFHRRHGKGPNPRCADPRRRRLVSNAARVVDHHIVRPQSSQPCARAQRLLKQQLKLGSWRSDNLERQVGQTPRSAPVYGLYLICTVPRLASATAANAAINRRCSAPAARCAALCSWMTALTRSPMDSMPTTRPPFTTGKCRNRPSVMSCMQWCTVSSGRHAHRRRTHDVAHRRVVR